MPDLRKALIEIAGHMGIPLSEQNSDGFLSAVSEEVRLTFARLTRERDEARRERDAAQRERDTAREALYRIVQWAEAYPLSVFPKPDKAYFKRAHEVLTANGMTLDRLSASAMRHVVEGVGKIARAALPDLPADNDASASPEPVK